MKKRLIIVANNSDWKSWPAKVEELKAWYAPHVDLEISLVHTNYSYVPFENLDGTVHGVNRAWYRTFIGPLAKGYDVILFVLPLSQWQDKKSRGSRDLVTNGAVFTQIGCDENDSILAKYLGYYPGELFFQLARHEILHALFYIKCGAGVVFNEPPTKGKCYDTTHYHWDRHQLELALDDLVPKAPEPVPIPKKIIHIVHHTATPRDSTNLDAILADHKKRYGRSFYQCFITADGTVHWQHKLLNTRTGAMSVDYCVVGDFTKEKPTPEQLNALNKLIYGLPVLGHNEASAYGATKSECPGTLLTDYRVWLDSATTTISLATHVIGLLRQLLDKK